MPSRRVRNGPWLQFAPSSVAGAARFVRRASALLLIACGARTGLDVGVVPGVEGNAIGCADGIREGFVDMAANPDIAGCSGGWSIPGVMIQNPGMAPECPGVPTFDTGSPACNRLAGNNGRNPNGIGCNVADLCADGWHVCTSAADVGSRSPSGCTAATLAGDPPLFFVSRQSSNGCLACATGTLTGPDCDSLECTTGCAQTADTSNDVFGCGNFGDNSAGSGPIADCEPLDRGTSNECALLQGSSWSCDADGSGLCEAFVLVHQGPDYGGALCCRD
jgi:hypothetical protein